MMQQGRPRIFNMDDVLQKAQDTFCELGYEGASISKLTKAMGINSPSLYTAFGDKEQLFIAVLERYYKPYFDHTRTTLFQEHRSTLDCLIDYIKNSMASHREQSNRSGCLIANSSIYIGKHYPIIDTTLRNLHRRSEELFVNRIEKGQSDGDVPKHINPLRLTRFLLAVFQGMSIQARGTQNDDAIRDIGNECISYITKRLTATT